MIFRVNKMASAGAAIWLPGKETFFMESSTMIATTKRYSCSVRFFRVLCSQTESYAQEITLFGLYLRTFARNFSNIDFFLKILPSKDDELVMSEM